MIEMDGGQHSIIYLQQALEKDDYIQLPTADTVSCRLKRSAIPSLFKIELFSCHISDEATRRLQTECNNIPAYTGRKRVRQQDTPQPAKVQDFKSM
jgi:hypothetical protein